MALAPTGWWDARPVAFVLVGDCKSVGVGEAVGKQVKEVPLPGAGGSLGAAPALPGDTHGVKQLQRRRE